METDGTRRNGDEMVEFVRRREKWGEINRGFPSAFSTQSNETNFEEMKRNEFFSVVAPHRLPAAEL